MPEHNYENYGEKAPRKLKNKVLFAIAAGLAIFVGLFIYADIKEVSRTFTQFKWDYIPLILALTTLNYLLRFLKWDYYLRCIGVTISKRDSLMIFLSGLTMSVTPAKLGEVSKSYFLKRLNGTEVSQSIPIVFAERITDVLGLLILAAISFSAYKYRLEMLIVILAILLTLITALRSRRICHQLINLSRYIPVVKKLSGSLRMAYDSVYTLFKLKILVLAVVISIVSWGFECLAMLYVLRGFGVDTTLLFSTFVFSFSSLAGAVSMVPGGLVIAEGSFAGLLILSGISKTIAASATMVIRFCTLWFGVIVGLITLLLIRKRIA